MMNEARTALKNKRGKRKKGKSEKEGTKRTRFRSTSLFRFVHFVSLLQPNPTIVTRDPVFVGVSLLLFYYNVKSEGKESVNRTTATTQHTQHQDLGLVHLCFWVLCCFFSFL